MQHLVFGAGLVGGYLAAALDASGCSVGLLARPGVREKMAAGLKITDLSGNEHNANELNFVEQPEESNRFSDYPEFLWLTVKCTALDSALEDAKAFIAPSTIIISLQNGLGSEEYIKEKFSENQVIRGVMSANIAELSEAHLHKATEGGIDLPELPETQPLQRLFQSDLLSLTLHNNLEGLLWAKLQLNLNNAVNALSGIPLLEQLHEPGYRAVMAATMDELLLVAKAKRIVLPKLTSVPASWIPRILRLPNWLFTRLAQKMLAVDSKARSSMWADLSRGRLTEVDFINGALVQEGEKVGVNCRINAALTELVHQAESGGMQIGLGAADLKSQLF